ncbi:hypothetical protein HFM87_16235 [Blautia producta]|nr:hypothetical protein [Blautia producta]NSG17407.1 hypothetical protein [Blautia producta]NSJ77583.1 hypothetical protein [Blautia producta]
MNVLEKILEEIENHAIEFESFGMCDDYVSIGWVKEIIRSHMDEVSGMRGKRLIDANALDEEVRNFFLAITGDPSQAMVVRECKESFRRIIDEQPTVYKANDWILVDERLPEARQHDNGEPIEFIAMIKRAGVPTVLSINEQDKWFRYDEMFCGEGRYNNYDVVAWQPLPNPYKGE